MKTTAILRWENGVIPDGHRHNFCHIASVLMVQYIKPENVKEHFEKWSLTIWPDLSHIQKFMDSDLQVMLEKALKDWTSGRRHKGYTYGKQSIIKKLNITKDEMKHLTVLIDDDERKDRKNHKRRVGGREDRQATTGLNREEWRSAVFQGSLKAEKPWEAMGVSRASYYRQKNKAT